MSVKEAKPTAGGHDAPHCRGFFALTGASIDCDPSASDTSTDIISTLQGGRPAHASIAGKGLLPSQAEVVDLSEDNYLDVVLQGTQRRVEHSLASMLG